MSTLTQDFAAWFDVAALVLPLLSFPLLLLAMLAWSRSRLLRQLVASDGFVRIALIVGSASIVLYLGQVVVYLVYPAYVDHVQTTIADMAFMLMHGHALYPPPNSEAIYGMPYGPALFLLDGLGISLDPSILGSKLPGAGALLATLVAMWAVLRRKLTHERAALIALATFVLLLLPYGLFAYWNRPESFLLLSAVLGLAALRLPRISAEIAVGLVLGLAAGLKLHGFLYAAPAAFALIGRGASLRQRAETLVLMAGSAASLLLLPFLLPNVSLLNYRDFLSLAAGHGLNLEMLWTSLALVAAFAGPAAVLWLWRRPSLSQEDRWLLVGLVGGILAVVLVAGRIAAGPYHVLPLIPSCLYAAAILADPALPGRAMPLERVHFWAAGVALALAVGFTGFLRNYGGLSVVELLHDRPAMSQAMVELGTFERDYPGAQMAAGDNDRYWLAMQGAALTMRSGRLAIDYATWMDLVLTGRDLDTLMPLVENCRVPSWIMPKDGVPFALTSIYNGEPLFSEAFRRQFLDAYVETRIGRFYRVWTCLKS